VTGPVAPGGGMTGAFVGLAIGVALGLAWGDATWEGGGSFPMALPVGALGAGLGWAAGRLSGRTRAPMLGGLAGAALGLAWGASAGDAASVVVLMVALGGAGLLLGRRLARPGDAGAGPPRRVVGRPVAGGAIGAALGLAWGASGDGVGTALVLTVIVGALGAGLGLLLDRGTEERGRRIVGALKGAGLGFVFGGLAGTSAAGDPLLALAGSLVGAAAGWVLAPPLARAREWRPPAGAAPVPPPAWAARLSGLAARIRALLWPTLAAAALALVWAGVEPPVANLRSASVDARLMGLACAMAYAAFAVRHGRLARLGEAAPVPAEAGGAAAARAVTAVRRWRPLLVAILVLGGAYLVARGVTPSYVSIAYREHVETRGRERVRVSTPVRRTHGGDILWLSLVGGGLLLLGAARLDRAPGGQPVTRS